MSTYGLIVEEVCPYGLQVEEICPYAIRTEEVPPAELSVLLPGTSTMVGSIMLRRDMQGTAAGTSSMVAQLASITGLSGNAAGSSGLIGVLVTGNQVPLVGLAEGTSAALAALVYDQYLTGLLPGTSSATGTLSSQTTLEGTAAGTSTMTGDLLGLTFHWQWGTTQLLLWGDGQLMLAWPELYEMQGTAAGSSSMVGTLTEHEEPETGLELRDRLDAPIFDRAGDQIYVRGSVATPLQGTAAGWSTLVGDLTQGLTLIEGTAAGTSSIVAALISSTIELMFGSAAGSSALTGNLTSDVTTGIRDRAGEVINDRAGSPIQGRS